jgi:putative methyltransferase (TIGR04325 family)
MSLVRKAGAALKTLVRKKLSGPRHIYRGRYASFAEVAVPASPWHENYVAMADNKVAGLRRLRDRPHWNPKELGGQAENAAVAALLCNLAADGGPFRVLDFGGAYGWLYYCLRQACPAMDASQWLVVDNEDAIAVGRHLGQGEPALSFRSSLPEPDWTCEVLFLFSVLEYVEDWQAMVERLLVHAPRHIMLAKVHACDGASFVTAQSVCGQWTPVRFFDVEDVTACFVARGYRPILKTFMPMPGEVFFGGSPADVVGSFTLAFSKE